MEPLPTITPPFFMESAYKNREIITSDIIYQNINLNLHQN